MQIFNVIIVRNAVVEDVFSFPFSKRAAAEKKFFSLIEENDVYIEDDAHRETLLDYGNCEIANGSVYLIPVTLED